MRMFANMYWFMQRTCGVFGLILTRIPVVELSKQKSYHDLIITMPCSLSYLIRILVAFSVFRRVLPQLCLIWIGKLTRNHYLNHTTVLTLGRALYQTEALLYESFNNLSPNYISQQLNIYSPARTWRSTINTFRLFIPRSLTIAGGRLPKIAAAMEWNFLPLHIWKSQFSVLRKPKYPLVLSIPIVFRHLCNNVCICSLFWTRYGAYIGVWIVFVNAGYHRHRHRHRCHYLHRNRHRHHHNHLYAEKPKMVHVTGVKNMLDGG